MVNLKLQCAHQKRARCAFANTVSVYNRYVPVILGIQFRYPTKNEVATPICARSTKHSSCPNSIENAEKRTESKIGQFEWKFFEFSRHSSSKSTSYWGRSLAKKLRQYCCEKIERWPREELAFVPNARTGCNVAPIPLRDVSGEFRVLTRNATLTHDRSLKEF